jgi:23S rRNA (uracil1939-C5)-methyltransferase
MAEATVTIERMCYGGAGLGRVDGKACFVPLSAPGDQARVRVVKEKRSFLEAELIELIQASELRVDPVCPAFGLCGGCQWQQLPYHEQLKQKAEIFSGNLSRIGRVQSDGILPVAASENRYGYRSRIQLKLARSGGRLVLGFHKTGSHDVVDLGAGCPIADPLLNRISAELRPLLESLPEGDRVPEIELSMGDDGEAIAVLHFGGKSTGKFSSLLLERRAELPSVTGLFVKSRAGKDMERVFGVESLSYKIPDALFPGAREMRLRFSRGGFSQVNYAQNLQLIKRVGEWGDFRGSERVLDLYCGNGNISLPIAPCVAEVVGIEGYAPSIEDARRNAAANTVSNATFEVSDASLAVSRLVKRGERFDVVLLDPPRAGAEAAAGIAQLKPEKIIYVSCDPATLSRDLAALCEKGYRVTRSQPVDMFPQTYHLESVTELQRL